MGRKVTRPTKRYLTVTKQKVNLNNHPKFMKKIKKSFCFKAPVTWCLKLAVDCNAAVERELSLIQYQSLCAGVIRVSF